MSDKPAQKESGAYAVGGIVALVFGLYVGA